MKRGGSSHSGSTGIKRGRIFERPGNQTQLPMDGGGGDIVAEGVADGLSSSTASSMMNRGD